MSGTERHRHRRSTSILVALSVVALFATAGPVHAGRVGPNLEFIQGPTGTSAGLPLATIQVAAKKAGRINTRYSRAVSLTLQGAGTLFGTTTVNAVAGVATFTDLVIDTAGTYTLFATSGRLAPATSAPFEITGVAENCELETCAISTGTVENPTPEDTIVGLVSVTTGECATETCFVTIDEVVTDICGGPCAGNGVKFVTPANTIGIVVVNFACDKTLCSGTGVPNFPLYLQKADLSIVPLGDCSEPEPDPSELPCIQSRSRTGVGDAIWEVWLTDTGDPVIGRG